MSHLDDIRARAEAATPGPWTTGGTASCGDVYFGTLVDPDDPTEPGVMLGMTGQPEDAEFIANAREDVPFLLAEIDRLNAKLAESGSAVALPHILNALAEQAEEEACAAQAKLIELADSGWVEKAAWMNTFDLADDRRRWLRAKAEEARA